jgi:hypothetical protein
MHFISVNALALRHLGVTLHFYLMSKKTGKFYHIGKVFFSLLSRRPRHCSSACRTNLTSSIHQRIQCSKSARWQKTRASTGPVLAERRVQGARARMLLHVGRRLPTLGSVRTCDLLWSQCLQTADAAAVILGWMDDGWTWDIQVSQNFQHWVVFNFWEEFNCDQNLRED